MRSVWRVPGLPAKLRQVYSKLSDERTLITSGGDRLIVYAGDVADIAASVVELIQLGLVERRIVEGSPVVVLGTWEVIERRFSSGTSKVSALFTADMSQTLERYSERQQRVIEQAFVSFGTLRKGGAVSPGVLLRQLQTYERYSVAAVIDGLRKYLEGGHAEQGKGERYALGIIRGCAKDAELKPAEEVAPEAQESPHDLQERRAAQSDRRERRDRMIFELAREEFGVSTLDQLPPWDLKRVIQCVDDRLRMEKQCGSS